MTDSILRKIVRAAVESFPVDIENRTALLRLILKELRHEDSQDYE